jgi:hypothetical protein
MAPATATLEKTRSSIASVRRVDLEALTRISMESARDERGVREAAARRSLLRLLRAEQSECTCPDFCERDHENE